MDEDRPGIATCTRRGGRRPTQAAPSTGGPPAVAAGARPARPRSTLGYMLFRHGVRAARGCPAARCAARSSRMAAATCRPRLWSSAVSASGSNPSVAQRTLGWLFTGGAVAAACGLANHVCDNPVFCQLAVELAQRDPRVAAAAGGAVSAKWWYIYATLTLLRLPFLSSYKPDQSSLRRGYAWSGTVFHNRAAVTIPLIVTGGSASTNW